MIVKRFIYPLIINLFFFNCILLATELSPWFGRDKEIDLKTSYLYQTSPSLALSSSTLPHERKHNLLHLSLASTPIDLWSAALELQMAHREHMDSRPSFSFGKLTLRNLLSNDLVGDPASVVLGGTFIYPRNKELTNLNMPPYTEASFECHLSVGKEHSQIETWNERTYALLALGSGKRGNPWSRILLSWEKNFSDHWQLMFSTEAMMALKGKKLHHYANDSQFKRASARFWDVEMSLRYPVEYVGVWDFSVRRRLYAASFPKDVFSAKIGFLFSFGL